MTASPTDRSRPATASTPSRCAHSQTAAPCSPATPSPPPSAARHPHPPPIPPSGDTTAPSQPGNLRVTAATAASVTIAWNAATDNVGVTGYDIYRATTKAGTTTTTSYTINGLTCGTAYSVGIRALDKAGNTSPQATLSITTSPCAPPPPSSTGAVKQTIANGATLSGLTNWRGVYDANGDGSEDDPGKMEFLIDGKLVLSEQLVPFGDSFADGSITTSNGQHTFQVRALTDSGTLLASNTVTATIGSQTPPPPVPIPAQR